MILSDDLGAEIDELPASGCAAATSLDDKRSVHAESFRHLEGLNDGQQVDSAKQLIHEFE